MASAEMGSTEMGPGEMGPGPGPMSTLDAYNSDKVRLQESILNVHDTLKAPQETSTAYKAIEEESDRLLYREEAIYRMVSTVTVLAVLFTGYRAFR
jgi:hypothetical protein